MLVLNLKVNPSKCVAENTSGEDGIYGASKQTREAPKKAAVRSVKSYVKSSPAPVVERKPIVIPEDPELIPPVFDEVEVTQLTDEQKKYAKAYEKMHKKEIDTSEYKLKVYIAQTKEQSKEKPKPVKRAQVTPEVINPETINPEEINAALPKIEEAVPEEIKKTNWFKRLWEKIKEFFRKLFKRKETKEDGSSEDLDS